MTMITPSYLGETIEYSSLHACRSTLEDPSLRPSAMLADGLSTALYVTPSDGASRLLAHFPGVTALVTLPDGRTNQLVGGGI